MTFTKAQADTMRRQYGVPEPVPVAYSNVTEDDFVTTYTQMQPEAVYGPGSGFHTFVDEAMHGIGAADDDIIDMTDVSEWSENSEAAPWHEAGELYAIAIREANTMRRRAFERAIDADDIPAWHPTLTDIFGHSWDIERERGIPAW